MRRVVVHVQRLVLDGFQARDRHSIGEGLQQELARVFADPVAVTRLTAAGDVPRLQVDGVSIEPRSKPERVGEMVGQGVSKELTR